MVVNCCRLRKGKGGKSNLKLTDAQRTKKKYRVRGILILNRHKSYVMLRAL